MPKLHVHQNSALGRIEYLDRKRVWWTLSVVYPLLPLLGLAAHAATDIS